MRNLANYKLQFPTQQKKQNTNSHIKNFLTIIVLLTITAMILTAAKRDLLKQQKTVPNNYFLSSKNNEPSPKTIQQTLGTKTNSKAEQIFQNEIPQLDGHWAVIAKNLNSGKTYQYHQTDIFPAASIYKLAVMWTAYQAQENGTLKFDETIGNWTVKDALNLMITVSDNDSAIAIAEKLGWDKIEAQMHKEGFLSFDLTSEDSPKVDAQDIAELLERINSDTAVGFDASNQMQNLLLAQQINDRIPAKLPNNVQVAHKTGEIDNFRHDAGIVIGKKSQYIFVFMTETDKPEETKDKIATLSREIYDALEQKD